MVDEVRRRVQQDTLGHRGRKGDPLYGIRRTLQIGAEHLTGGSANRSSATSTTPGLRGAGNSWPRWSLRSRPVRSRRSHGWAGRSNNGRQRFWPTSTPSAPVSRAKLTTRAVGWATDALQRFDTSVSALAHQLGVSWHTIWDAVRAEAARRIAATDRLQGVDALGVDEHVWSHTGPPGTGMGTGS
jgi:hypothetical protein